jgi:hypothetical protein
VEVIGSGKHSSLLRYGNNYCRKMFYSTGPSLFRKFVTYDRKKFYNIGPNWLSTTQYQKKSFMKLKPGTPWWKKSSLVYKIFCCWQQSVTNRSLPSKTPTTSTRPDGTPSRPGTLTIKTFFVVIDAQDKLERLP